MGISYRISRIILVLLLIGWIPSVASAFSPGGFIVSPRQVDMGTIPVAPGASAGPFSFTISVVGGPVPDNDDESNTFFLSTDAPWLSVSQQGNESPGNAIVSVNILATMAEGLWQTNIKITSGLDPFMAPVSIPVSMRLVRSTGDFLTVSPTHLDLVVSGSDALKQTLPISITNADPDRTVFDWSAQPSASWLTLSAYSGTGNGTIELTVNPQLLPLNEDLDGDGVLDGATATVTFRSNLNANAVVLTVKCRISTSGFIPGEFTVSPRQIDMGTIPVTPGETAGPFLFNISVLGGPLPDTGSNRSAVFLPSTDASWVSLSTTASTSPGVVTARVSISGTMEGEHETDIIILSGLDPETAPVSIPVRVNVVRIIENRLAVSPASLDLVVTSQNATQQTFPVKITNADPHKTDYDWSAQSDVLWLTLSQASGTGNSDISLTVDPQLLPLSEDLDGDGILDGAVGTITVHSSLNMEAVVLTVRLRVAPGLEPDFIPGNFNVSPQNIDFGTIRVLPGAAAGSFSLNISIVGGPVPNSVSGAVEKTSAFVAVSDQHWLTVTPAVGETPGTLTASLNIPETMPDGEHRANIIITSGLDTAMSPVTIPVTMTVQRRINDLLTVSPTSLNLNVTEKIAGPQTYPVFIANANPYNNSFDWQAHIDVQWLTLSSSSGVGNSQVSLTMDPQQLTLSQDLNGDGILNGAMGTVTIRSSQMADPVTLTVSAGIATSYDLSVHPGQLYWSIEKQGDDQMLEPDPQYLQIFAGRTGWTVSSDVHFLTIIADDMGASIDTQISTHPYGCVEVTPIAGLIQGMDYGYHTGNITISDRYSQFFRIVPVTIHIRRPGESVGLPVSSPESYQIRPDYSMIETAAASRIHLQLPVPDSLAYYPTQMACDNANGQWIDPDSIPGNLNEYCSLNQQVYVLMAFPEMVPGMIYAWNRIGQFSPAYVNGIKTPDADTLTYADGPVPVIPLGPVQLLEYHGSMIISIRIGRNLDAAVETQRIQINIRTPEGRWNVTESYQGQVYSYDNSRLLELHRTPGAPGYFSGTWGGAPVNMVPGDGITWLHQMEFSQNGIHYIYQIQALSANQISGKWRFSWPGGVSSWETFQARRQMLPLRFPIQ